MLGRWREQRLPLSGSPLCAEIGARSQAWRVPGWSLRWDAVVLSEPVTPQWSWGTQTFYEPHIWPSVLSSLESRAQGSISYHMYHRTPSGPLRGSGGRSGWGQSSCISMFGPVSLNHSAVTFGLNTSWLWGLSWRGVGCSLRFHYSLAVNSAPTPASILNN